jgi:hypothetical protein
MSEKSIKKREAVLDAKLGSTAGCWYWHVPRRQLLLVWAGVPRVYLAELLCRKGHARVGGITTRYANKATFSSCPPLSHKFLACIYLHHSLGLLQALPRAFDQRFQPRLLSADALLFFAWMAAACSNFLCACFRLHEAASGLCTTGLGALKVTSPLPASAARRAAAATTSAGDLS